MSSQKNNGHGIQNKTMLQNKNIKGSINNLINTKTLYANNADVSRKADHAEWEIEHMICMDIVAWVSYLSSKEGLTGQLLVNSEKDRAELSIELKNDLVWDLDYFQVAISLKDESQDDIGEAVLKAENWWSGETHKFMLDVSPYTKSICLLAPTIIYRVSSQSIDERKQQLLEGDSVLCKYCREVIPRYSLYCNHCGMQLMTPEQRDLLKVKDKKREVMWEKSVFDSYTENYLSKLDGNEDLQEQVKLLEEKSEKAFARIYERPEYLRYIKKYSNIYLPKLENAVETYCSIKNGGVSPEGVENARDNLEQALEIGNHSMQSLIESLYQSDQLDVATDLEVLKQMFLNGHEEIIEFNEKKNKSLE